MFRALSARRRIGVGASVLVIGFIGFIGFIGPFRIQQAAAHEPGEEAPALHTAPLLVERVEPAYPEEARAQGLGGTVSLEIAVAADGTVSAVKVTSGIGHGLDEAAVEAARRFRFRPATERGQPVPATVSFDQSFVVQTRLRAEARVTPPDAETVIEAPQNREAREAAETGTPEPAAGRYQSRVTGRAPTSAASASTIRNQDFDLRPMSSPNDVLRVVPGLMTAQHQGGGKADQLFLRGFDADHGTDVALYIDGVPINLPSHAHGQGYSDLHFVIPEAIERLDVVKGPYDVRFGDFATAGAVNLVTRTKFDESSVQVSLGGFPTLGCKQLDFDAPRGGADCKLVATQRFVGVAAPELSGWAARLHPWIAFEAAHDDGPFDNPEKLRRYNLFAKLSWDVSPSTVVGVFFSAYGSSWIGSGQVPARAVASGQIGPFGSLDPSEGGLTEREMLTAFLRYKSGGSEFTATAYFTRYQLSLWNDFTYFLEDPVHASEIEQDDNRTVTGLRADYHFHRRWRGLSFRTTLGVDARFDSTHVDRFDAESCSTNGSPAAACPGGDFRKRLGRHVDGSAYAFAGNNDDIGILNVSGYAEEDVVFHRMFRLVGGLRADWFGWNVVDGSEVQGAGNPATSGVAQRAVVSPKLTAVISPVPGTWDIYLNYGSGFHSNMAQVALVDGQRIYGQNADGTRSALFTAHALPLLYGGELGTRLRLWDRVDLAGALWVSYLQNETVFDADHSAFVPSVATLRWGVDIEARARVFDWLYLDIDVAQATATAQPDSGNGGAIALAPRFYMTGGATAKHAFGEKGAHLVRGGLRFRVLGDRPAFDETSPEYQYFTARTLANGQPNPDYNPARVTAAGYGVIDLYAGYRYRWFEVSAAVQNLLNTAWREAQFGNHSCTYDETYNQANPYFSGSGNKLSDGSVANRCGYRPGDAAWNATRSGVADVHYTPGVPFNLTLTVKAYF